MGFYEEISLQEYQLISVVPKNPCLFERSNLFNGPSVVFVNISLYAGQLIYEPELLSINPTGLERCSRCESSRYESIINLHPS